VTALATGQSYPYAVAVDGTHVYWVDYEGGTVNKVECPRFRGHLSAWSALSGLAGRIVRHAKRIELQEAVPAGVSA
jgi:hypothetical protein